MNLYLKTLLSKKVNKKLFNAFYMHTKIDIFFNFLAVNFIQKLHKI